MPVHVHTDLPTFRSGRRSTRCGRSVYRGTANQGSAMLAAICFATVLAIALTSYLTLCYRTLQLSSRSMQGTRSIELAETGMEDALWALNKNDWTDWTIDGTTATKVQSEIPFDGGVRGAITLRITSYNGTAGPRVVTATGTTTLADGTNVSRTLTSSSAKAPLFVNAVAGVTGKVRFRSGGTVDSYDSSLGEYATQTPGYSAILSSGSTSTNSATVQIGLATVKGYVATLSTGPSYSNGARLIGPTTSGTTTIDTARISTSPYQPLFEEVRPTGVGSTLPSGTTTVGVPGATTEALYTATNINLTGTQVLTIDGPVALVVSGDFYISSSAKIVITSHGSLRVHVGGDIAINGLGVQNDTKLPKKLLIIATTNPYDTYGMATNTPFYGVIYTPVSSLTVSNSQTIYGAIVAKSVTFSASPVFHYDVDLRRTVSNGFVTPYAVGNVRETTAQ